MTDRRCFLHRRCLPLACWVFLALSLGCAGTRAVRTPEAFMPPPPDQTPIRLVLATVQGTHVDVADHRGIAVLVIAFTTSEIASQALLRNVEAVARAHPEDLAVIAVAGDTFPPRDEVSLLHAYADVLGLRAVTLCLATDAMRDGNSPLGDIRRVPTTFLVNRLGVIAHSVEGYLSVPQIEGLIAPALPPHVQ